MPYYIIVMYTNIIHNDDICNYFLKNQQFIFNSLGNCRECRLKEAVDFIPLEKVPEPVRKIRDDKRIFPCDTAHDDERVILYKKVVKLDREKMMENASWNYSGVNDIIRLQVNSFLRKMDNPLVELDRVSEDGNVISEMLPKLYYINIVLEYHYDEVTDYKHLRIALTRDGIQKIEELS